MAIIKIKRNTTAGVVPANSTLQIGELAINTEDGVLYGSKNDGTIQEVGGPAARTMAGYTALRAYAGKSAAVRLTATGIAGVFWRDDSDTTSTDNGGTIIVSSNGKRWKRLFTGSVNLRWFGAKGDVTTDDTAAWQNAVLFAARNHFELFVPDGVYKVTAKAVVDGTADTFSAVRIRGNGSATGAELRADPTKCGPVIYTTGGGALEVWFRQWNNEKIDIRGVSFYDAAAYPSDGRAAVPAIKIKKGDPSGSLRYISNLNFHDIAACGYEEPIVFQGMYSYADAASWGLNFLGPLHIERYFPYNNGCAMTFANCTANRFSMRDSLVHGTTSGAIRLKKDGDLAAGTGTGGLLMAEFAMVHFEDCKGWFYADHSTDFYDGGKLVKNQLTFMDVTDEFCGVYGPVGAGGFYQGDRLGLTALKSDIRFLGRCDYDTTYGSEGRIEIGSGSSISSQALINVKLAAGAIKETPSTVNVIYKTFDLPVNTTVSKNIVVAEGAYVGFEADVTISVDGGDMGTKYIKTNGRTGGVIRRYETGDFGMGIVLTYPTYGSADLLAVSVKNDTIYPMTFTLRLETRTPVQLYIP